MCPTELAPSTGLVKTAVGGGSSDISMAGRKLGRAWPLPMGHMSPSSARCCRSLDTLGFEPRAFRMRSGCDTTTPCAPQNMRLHRSSPHNSWWGPRANPRRVEACGGPGRCPCATCCPAVRCCRSLGTLGFEPRASRMRSGCDTTTPCAPQNLPHPQVS